MSTESPIFPPAPKSSITETFLEGRLHPLTLALGLIGSLRKLIIPSIPILIIGNKMRWGGIGLIGLMLIGTVVTLLLRYFSFRYSIQGRDLVTSEGIIGRKERHIPLEQIHEIRIEQNVLQRVFDVVEAVVETAGGEGAEAKLSVLSRSDAENLRSAVASRSAHKNISTLAQPENIQARPESIIRKLDLRDLILHGLTSNHFLSALAIFGALWAFVNEVLPNTVFQYIAKYLKVAVGEMAHQGLQGAILIASVAFIVAMVVGLLVSVVGSVVLFFDYTLSRRAGELYRSYGLLTRRASSVPQRRIQVLKIEETMIRRWFGLATIRADVSGSKKEHEDDNKGRDVMLPIAMRDELPELLTEFFPQLAHDEVKWKNVSPLAIRRHTIVSTVFILLIVGGIFAATKSLFSLVFLLFIPLVYWLNVKSYREFGYALGTQFFRTRKGWLGRALHIVPLEKSQVIVVRQSPFERRLGLATLSIDTAGQSYAGGSPRIGNLPLDEAMNLARTLAQKAAQAGPEF